MKKLFEFSFLILAFLLSGCGAGGDTGGNADISHLSNLPKNSTQAVLNISGVFSGKDSALSAPLRVYAQPGLKVKLVSASAEYFFPILPANCFKLTGIPRESDHYIIKFYEGNTLIADFPMDFTDYSTVNDLLVRSEILVDKVRKRVVVTQMLENNLGATPTYRRVLMERPTPDSVPELLMGNISTASYDEMKINGILSYYEATAAETWEFPDDYFTENILRKKHDGEQNSLSNDLNASGDDPFYDSRETIASSLSVAALDMRSSSLKVLMGTMKDQSAASIPINGAFYASLIFYDAEDEQIDPLDFYLTVRAETATGWAVKSARFVNGVPYREDGTMITSIEHEDREYYIGYPNLSVFGTTGETQEITFTMSASFADGYIVNASSKKIFTP